MNTDAIKEHKILFIISLSLIGILFIFSILLLFSSPQKKQSSLSPFITPTILERHAGFSLSAFLPGTDTPLEGNKIQRFTLVFNESLSSDALTSSIQETIIGSDIHTSVPSTVSFNEAGNEVTITSTRPFKQNASYQVLLKKTKDNAVLFNKNYFTLAFTPTPLPNNNKALSESLPHEGSNWILKYNPERNLYYFSADITPGTPAEMEIQYNRAKDEALTFIKSKGIDPNTVTIEWNR